MVEGDVEKRAPQEEIPHDHLFIVTGLSSTNLDKLAHESSRADFEHAIATTEYGKFNILLMLCALPGFWSAVSVPGATSYIFTRAQCDMNLSLLDMGTITAMTYGGMITSAMIWGFLSDTLGRKRIMVWGFLGAGLNEILSAMSQNFPMILVTRFTSGFLFNGPFAVLISYLAELHRTELRARVILLSSLFYTFGNITLPLLAWGILTQESQFHIFGDTFVMKSWNLFLLATASVPILTGLAFSFLPESPKFLMSRGRNEEAMAVFQKIFAMNTGKPPSDYPIKSLVEEKSEEQSKGFAALRGGSAQLKPLYQPPHFKWLCLICCIYMGCTFGTNTIRLWYPQLAAMIGSGSSQSLCAAIAPSATAAPTDLVTCKPIETDMLTYLQSAAVGAGSVLTYGIGSILVNKLGKRIVCGFCAISGSILIMMMPFLGSSSTIVVALVTTVLAVTSLTAAALSSITVDLFPTSLRVMALATFLMTGRIGTITGTIIFPALISYGCYPPFITISLVIGVCGFACFLLPNTTLKKLE